MISDTLSFANAVFTPLNDTFDLANVSNRPGITIIHATDDPSESEKEVNIWFNPSEIYSYDKPDQKVHYRKF